MGKRTISSLHGHIKHHLKKDAEILIILFIFMFFLFVLPLLSSGNITGNTIRKSITFASASSLVFFLFFTLLIGGIFLFLITLTKN